MKRLRLTIWLLILDAIHSIFGYCRAYYWILGRAARVEWEDS
jgi:hypothetical protein